MIRELTVALFRMAADGWRARRFVISGGSATGFAAALVLTCWFAAIPGAARAQPMRLDEPLSASFQEQEEPAAEYSARDLLLLHGVNPAADSLLRFLQQGFSEAALSREMPREPRAKTQLLIFAMQELGAARETRAVEPLLKILHRQFPPGAQQVMRLDLQGIEAAFAQQERTRLETSLVYNAMVALGWIGDTAAAPAIREAMRQESGSRFQTQGALALAMLGDTSALDEVARLMRKGETAEQAGAARVFYYITGRYYALGPNVSKARRKANLADLELWMKNERPLFETTAAEVRRRRSLPYPPPQPGPPPGSARALVAASVNIAGDYAASFEARQAILARGADALPDLEAIARDPMEDLLTRRMAMRLHLYLAGPGSRKLLRSLRNDENPPVAELAKTLLKTLEEKR